MYTNEAVDSVLLLILIFIKGRKKQEIKKILVYNNSWLYFHCDNHNLSKKTRNDSFLQI